MKALPCVLGGGGGVPSKGETKIGSETQNYHVPVGFLLASPCSACPHVHFKVLSWVHSAYLAVVLLPPPRQEYRKFPPYM